MIIRLPLPNNREDWLKQRKPRLGGADAAAVSGFSRYASPLSVYCDKLDLVPEREDNEAMRQGRDLEDYVARRWCEETGLKVRRENSILVNDAYPWMHASIDRRVVGLDEGLECKTTSVYNKTDFAGGDVPHEYYVQCVHYLAVTGFKRWHLAVLVLNKGFYTFTIERNEAEIEALAELERKFYDDHIVAKVPPEATELDSDLLATLHPYGESRFVPLHDVSAELDNLSSLKSQAKALDAEITKLENIVKQALGDADEGADERYSVTWKNRTSSRFDATTLKETLPDVYRQYLKTTTSRTFLLKPLKEDK